MSKAWCCWCEPPQSNTPRSGAFWIHKECFTEITDMKDNLEHIQNALAGHEPIDVIKGLGLLDAVKAVAA